MNKCQQATCYHRAIDLKVSMAKISTDLVMPAKNESDFKQKVSMAKYRHTTSELPAENINSFKKATCTQTMGDSVSVDKDYSN